MIQRQCSETTAFLSTTLTCTMIPRQCAVFPSRTYQWKLVALWGAKQVTSSHVTSCSFKALSLCLKLHCWEFKESKITNHNHGGWHEIPLWYLYSLPYIVLQTRVDHNRWILQAMMVGQACEMRKSYFFHLQSVFEIGALTYLWNVLLLQFYQALPHISTASDKRWGEKAWVRG